MRKLLFIACAVAVAGAAIDVHASEYNVGSESETLGEFGNEDSTVFDNFMDLLDNVSDSGFDFASPSPDSDPVPDTVSANNLPSSTPYVTVPGSDVYSDSDILPPGDFDTDSDLTDVPVPLADYDAYYGSINSTYLEFMRGFLPKLGFKEHYVAARTSQYNYIFAYGEDLVFDSGHTFSGTDITVITFSTYGNGSYVVGFDSSFYLNPHNYLVYSDLSKVYPSLADTAGFTLRQILILITIFILCLVIDHMYQVRKIRRINSR